MAGMGAATNATMILPAGNAGASALTYSFSQDGAVTNTLGATAEIKQWEGGCLGLGTQRLYAYYGHGTQTISQVVMTITGITCTFTLENPLVITNASSVNQT